MLGWKLETTYTARNNYRPLIVYRANARHTSSRQFYSVCGGVNHIHWSSLTFSGVALRLRSDPVFPFPLRSTAGLPLRLRLSLLGEAERERERDASFLADFSGVTLREREREAFFLGERETLREWDLPRADRFGLRLALLDFDRLSRPRPRPFLGDGLREESRRLLGETERFLLLLLSRRLRLLPVLRERERRSRERDLERRRRSRERERLRLRDEEEPSYR